MRPGGPLNATGWLGVRPQRRPSPPRQRVGFSDPPRAQLSRGILPRFELPFPESAAPHPVSLQPRSALAFLSRPDFEHRRRRPFPFSRLRLSNSVPLQSHGGFSSHNGTMIVCRDVFHGCRRQARLDGPTSVVLRGNRSAVASVQPLSTSSDASAPSSAAGSGRPKGSPARPHRSRGVTSLLPGRPFAGAGRGCGADQRIAV